MLDYHFEGQKEDEQIFLVAKQHPWLLFWPGSKIFILFIIWVLTLIYFKASFISSLAFFILLLGGGSYGFITWFLWRNYVYIVTNQRLVVVQQKGLFHRQVTEAPLDKIQEVTFEVKTVFQNLFDFGTVKVHTAGAQQIIQLQNVINPYGVQQEILKAQQRYKRL